MAPPPFIPQLDSEAYDKDVVAGLERLHNQGASDESPPQEVPSQAHLHQQRGATDPTDSSLISRRGEERAHRSLPTTQASAHLPQTQPPNSPWPFATTSDSPDPISSRSPPASSAHVRTPFNPAPRQLTTIYSSSGPAAIPSHDLTSLPPISIPTADQPRTSSLPHLSSHPPILSATHSRPSQSNSRQAFISPQRTNTTPKGSAAIMHPSRPSPVPTRPSPNAEDTDDQASSRGGLPAATSPGPGTLSGGVSMGPTISEFASIGPTPGGQLSPSHMRRPHPQNGGYTRSPSGPVGQPGAPPQFHPSQSQQNTHPPTSYYPPHSPQDYTSRTSPSPTYMGSPYGMQYSPHHLQQHRPSYQGHVSSPYAMVSPTQQPHLVSVPSGFPPFSQAYGHLGVSPADGGGYMAPMYGGQQPPYLTPPGPENHSPNSGGSGPDPFVVPHGGSPNVYPPQSSAVPGVGGPPVLSNSPSGFGSGSGRGSGGRPSAQPPSQPPMMGHPYQRISPHSLPHPASPVAHPHSHSPMSSYPSPYAGGPQAAAGPAYSPYSYPYPSHPTSPVIQTFGHQYPSSPLGPQHMEDPRNPPMHMGTWWYVPPGGQARPFPTQQAGYDYQGPFTMGFGTPPVPAEDVAVPTPPSVPHPTSPTSYNPPPTHPRGGGQQQRYTGPPRRGSYARGATTGPRARGGSRPRGGGPTGAGLAAGSPSGGSASHSHPSSDSAKAAAVPSRPPFTPSLLAARKGKGKDPVRQAFHPKPQTHGHEWVMWVGNVPDHATQTEVWEFFRNPKALVYYLSTKQRSEGGPDAANPQEGASADSTGADDGEEELKDGGVSSVFLIKSSNCAFVNFETEEALSRAMKTFNGVPLRPYDQDCLPLVCRIRRKDDDLRTGVAAQRGWGLHTNWIRLQAEAMKKSGAVPNSPESPTVHQRKVRDAQQQPDGVEGDTGEDGAAAAVDGTEEDISSPQIMLPGHLKSHDDPPTSPSTHLGPSSNSDPSPPIASKYGGSKRPPLGAARQSGSTSSGSYASTNSSFLAKYFPKRYFILKSLSEYDLNLSVERGVWATQPHNEPILDQAFRTSKEVHLIFGANKSGEFFGYARMVGGISRADKPVPWASRSQSQSASSAGSSGPRQPVSYSVILEDPAAEKEPPSEQGQSSSLLADGVSKSSILASSPLPISPGQADGMPSPTPHTHAPQRPRGGQGAKAFDHRSAPAELGPSRRGFSKLDIPPHAGETLDIPSRLATATFGASPNRAEPVLDPTAPLRNAKRPELLDPQDVAVTEDEIKRRAENEGSSLAKAIGQEQGQPETSRNETWGTPFAIQWIKTERLPFARLKRLRNPWNYDREVKISRDGIELEPSTGEALLREWDKMEAEKQDFQRVLQSQWYQRDGKWFRSDGASTSDQPDGDSSITPGNVSSPNDQLSPRHTRPNTRTPQ